MIVVLLLTIPGFAFAQTSNNNNDLLESIRAIFEESLSELSAEIVRLRQEVENLSAQVQSQGSGGTGPIPVPVENEVPFAPLAHGDSGPEVEKLQQLLIRFGFSIPAGVTGSYFFQTESAVTQFQQQYSLAITGVYDMMTRSLFIQLLEFDDGTPPVIPPEPVLPPVEARINLTTPYNGMLLRFSSDIVIKWNSADAPQNSRIVIHMIHEQTGTDIPVFETNEFTGTYNWIVPSYAPGNNTMFAELIDETNEVLATSAITFSILGGEVVIPTTPTPGTGPNERYADFYKGTAFVTCMAEYPETINLIHSWIDDDLLRYQFPWGQITGAAASKVAACEGTEFPDDNYVDCLDHTTASTCAEQVGCTWYDTFCGQDGYTGTNGGSSQCNLGFHFEYYEGSSVVCFTESGEHDEYQIDGSLTTSCSITSRQGCPGVINGGSDDTTSSYYSCFYTNATVNGEAPGYTVWCEYDYQNCRVGDSSGETISLTGLALGAPSSCESVAPTSAANRFVANLAAAFNQLVDTFQKVFGK